MADEEDISLDDIVDPILLSRVQGLIPAMGTSFKTREIRDAILTCHGDVNDATDLLFGEPPQEIQKAAGILEQKFPFTLKYNIMDTLIRCSGDTQLAESRLSKQANMQDRGGNAPNEQNPTATIGLDDETINIIRAHSEINQTAGKMDAAEDNTQDSKRSDESTGTHQIIEIKDEDEDKKTIETTNDMSYSDLTSLNSADIYALPGQIPATSATSTAPTILAVTGEGPEMAEASQSRVKFLQEMLGHPITEQECEGTLRRCNGSVEKAWEILQRRIGLNNHDNDDNEMRTIKDFSPDSKQSLFKFNNSESTGRGQKRTGTSVDDFSHKRLKSHLEDEDETSEVEEPDEESSALEPASEWVKKYFPGGRRAIILLGPDEELRDTIPRKVLYDNSSFFSDHYDTAEAEDWDDDTVRLPDVDPQMFDLVIQFLVSKKFTLEPDPNRSRSTEITIILDLVFLADRLGFPDPSVPVVEKLREILIENRKALRRKHMKRAFELEEDHDIQRLFVQAVARDYMKTRNSQLNSNETDTEDTEDDDDESVYPDAAHRAFHNIDKFCFRRELKSIRAFKIQLLEEQDSILKAGKEVEARHATRRKHATNIIKYEDPLDREQFYL